MNQDEFIKCVERSQESLRRFLASVCAGDVELAEDIAQEAYIKAYLARGKIKDADNFRAWITKIAYNTFLNIIRKKRINIPIEEIAYNESFGRLDDTFKYESLYQALKSLGAKERTVLVLFYLEGYNTREISDFLEIKEEAVRQILSRGRKRLKTLID